jgi:hypothetical protein
VTTGSLVYPAVALGAGSLQLRLVGQAISGGVSLSGEQQFADASGGGRWVGDFGDIALMTREARLLYRRFVAAADGGAQSLIVPVADRLHQPVNPKYTGADTFGTTTWVDDVTAWSNTEVTATTTADMALSATSCTFNLTAPLALMGGELFSILHATMSWRLYRVSRVVSGGTVGSAVSTQVQFRPPLREAVASGAALNFESPRFVARVDGDISETVQQFRFGKAAARLIEYPGAP